MIWVCAAKLVGSWMCEWLLSRKPQGRNHSEVQFPPSPDSFPPNLCSPCLHLIPTLKPISQANVGFPNTHCCRTKTLNQCGGNTCNISYTYYKEPVAWCVWNSRWRGCRYLVGGKSTCGKMSVGVLCWWRDKWVIGNSRLCQHLAPVVELIPDPTRLHRKYPLLPLLLRRGGAAGLPGLWQSSIAAVLLSDSSYSSAGCWITLEQLISRCSQREAPFRVLRLDGPYRC